MVQTKHRSDVHFTVNIKRLTNGDLKPVISILTKNTDATTKSNVYASLEDLSKDFPENTNLYKIAEAIFDVDSFNNQLLEVISYPNADVTKPTNVMVKPTAVGAKVSATPTPGIVAAMQAHVWDGMLYTLVDGGTEADYEALSDYLYKQQRVMLIARLFNTSDFQKLAQHVQSTQTTANTLGNTYAVVDTSTDRFPEAQAAAFAASNIPTDFMHIGGLSEFEVDKNLSDDDADDITNAYGAVVVNKADDLMLSTGRALCGTNYVDQFVHVQYIIDQWTNAIQKYLNAHKWPRYDDKTIGELKALVVTLGINFYTMGILAAKVSDDDVTTIAYANVLPSLVEKREYNGLGVNAQVANSVETLNAKANLLV